MIDKCTERVYLCDPVRLEIAKCTQTNPGLSGYFDPVGQRTVASGDLCTPVQGPRYVVTEPLLAFLWGE